jgi:hypothetical protein
MLRPPTRFPLCRLGPVATSSNRTTRCPPGLSPAPTIPPLAPDSTLATSSLLVLARRAQVIIIARQKRRRLPALQPSSGALSTVLPGRLTINSHNHSISYYQTIVNRLGARFATLPQKYYLSLHHPSPDSPPIQSTGTAGQSAQADFAAIRRVLQPKDHSPARPTTRATRPRHARHFMNPRQIRGPGSFRLSSGCRI